MRTQRCRLPKTAKVQLRLNLKCLTISPPEETLEPEYRQLGGDRYRDLRCLQQPARRSETYHLSQNPSPDSHRPALTRVVLLVPRMESWLSPSISARSIILAHVQAKRRDLSRKHRRRAEQIKRTPLSSLSDCFST